MLKIPRRQSVRGTLRTTATQSRAQHTRPLRLFANATDATGHVPETDDDHRASLIVRLWELGRRELTDAVASPRLRSDLIRFDLTSSFHDER